MTNTASWDDPNTVQTKQGQTTPGVVYLVDPSTQKVIAVQWATADALAQAGVPETAVGIYTPGSGIDRWRSAGGDGVNVGLGAIVPHLFNGATHDQQRGNVDALTLVASAALTSNQTSGDQTNYNGKGLLLFIKTGAFGSGASGIVATIQGKDPVSGQVYTILASAALTASSFTVLRVYPNLTTAANLVANDVLPRTWNVTLNATAWGTGGSTVGVAACVVV